MMFHDPDMMRLQRDLEPLISGTLVLMTAVQHPGSCVHLPAKIVSNLARLGAHPQLTLQTAVDRLITAGSGREHEEFWPRRSSPIG
jgi:hypothetical protein